MKFSPSFSFKRQSNISLLARISDATRNVRALGIHGNRKRNKG